MKLTDAQQIVLAAALKRRNRSILPLPDHIKGGAIAKVCSALLAHGLAAEVAAQKGDPIWREMDSGPAQTLIATQAAREALGIPAEAPEEPAPEELRPQAAAPVPTEGGRANTKQAQLIAMLKTPDGASIDEIATAFGWQPHTVRGAIAGALKKKLGLNIDSQRIEGRGRVYRILD